MSSVARVGRTVSTAPTLTIHMLSSLNAEAVEMPTWAREKIVIGPSTQ